MPLAEGWCALSVAGCEVGMRKRAKEKARAVSRAFGAVVWIVGGKRCTGVH